MWMTVKGQRVELADGLLDKQKQRKDRENGRDSSLPSCSFTKKDAMPLRTSTPRLDLGRDIPSFRSQGRHWSTEEIATILK